DAECFQNLFKLGFGFVEVGSVTPVAQDGNQRPRVFRLPADEAIVNRCGFNSAGHDVVLGRLESTPRPENGFVGVNLGKNKTSPDAKKDFADGVRKFAPVADYLVINISSPNTPGLRALQGDAELPGVLAAVKSAKDEMEPQRGVFTGDDAYAKIRAGASLVQLYTAMVYHGPGVVASIKARLRELLANDGFQTLYDAVGADHERTTAGS
ncbi:unnamed protein product, partial [Notodromas monacha]